MATQHEIDALREAGSVTPGQPGGIPGWNASIPVIRISTCGLFTVEILQEVPEDKSASPRYAQLLPERLHGPGHGRALTLLQLLVTKPGRFASKDWLMTHLREGENTCITEKRLENIVSFLRGLLALPSGKKLSDLIVYVRATQDSGDGYRLAPFPLVWLDIDALAWNVQQAALKERFNDNALPYWERASALASRGRFLIEEPTSEWAQVRREAVEDQLRQCVHALSRLYLARFGQAGEEEVLRILLPHCRMHPQDEDALRALLELLCQRGRYQEVLEWYDRLEAALDADGLTKTGKVRTPHPLTAEIAAFARLKQREFRQAANRVVQTRSDVLSLPPRMVSQTEPPAGSINGESALVQTEPLTASPTIVVPALPACADANMTIGSLAPSCVVETEDDGASLLDRFEAFSGPLFAETRHLLGRQAWLDSIMQMVQASLPKKLIVLHGPIGIGKSSELNRLAQQFQSLDHHSMRVVAIPFLAAEQYPDPETALDVFLGTVLHESQSAPFPAHASQQTLTKLVLSTLELQKEPMVILLDNAECLLTEQGRLSPCWETFLARYLRSLHQTTLILATKEWHGWPGRDSIFVAETDLPPLTPAESVSLLQRLGLQNIPTEQLQTVGRHLAGIPLLLEWTAKLGNYTAP